MKPWREVAVPHDDVMKGNFQEAEFAADITRVHDGTASPEYRDPELFFRRTFITEGMRLLLDAVARRLCGTGGEPVIQLQTAFGGGKTHTMLAVYHLVGSKTPPGRLAGVPPILDAAGVLELPKARVVVLDGVALSPDTPRKRGAVTVRTLWGELAWQLGGEAAFRQVAQADGSGVSPGKEVLVRLLAAHAPCVLLVDELTAYIRQFPGSVVLAGGSFDSNLSFVQALTEALKAVPTAVLLAALPESWQAGGPHGMAALAALKDYFGRVHAIWKPVATEESFEIVRRRLFTEIADPAAVEETCRAFARMYAESPAGFPLSAQEGRYLERMARSYPIHPEVFDRLYEDWTPLENFQRTRGVLKLMAKAIHRLWKDGNSDAMILPGSLPLYDTSYRNEALYYLLPGWDAVIEREIDGDLSRPAEIDGHDPRFGAPRACRKVARALFLGSAPASPQAPIRGIDRKHVLLGTLQPGESAGTYTDALNRLAEQLHYLNRADDRFWFDTTPNLRREMEERKLRFRGPEQVVPELRALLQGMIGHGIFKAVHVFTPHADIPDDLGLRLVVLPPGAAYSAAARKGVESRAAEVLTRRGDQPRARQNRLLFLAADAEALEGLFDKAASRLAWQSILDDYREARLTLDNRVAKTVEEELKKAKESLARAARDTYRWLVVPAQEGQGGGPAAAIHWEYLALNPGAPDYTREMAEVLRGAEAVIEAWSPLFLAGLLKTWFWKGEVRDVAARDVWVKMGSQLFMERLRDEEVFKRCIEEGSGSRDYFGLADGREGEEYLGFSFGKGRQARLDERFMLVEPGAAAAYERELQRREEEARRAAGGAATGAGGGAADAPAGGPGAGPVGIPAAGGGTQPRPPAAASRRYFGSKRLNPLKAQSEFNEVVEEVVLQFTSRGYDTTIRVDIEARAPKGFDESIRRNVKTNGEVLKFEVNEFAEE